MTKLPRSCLHLTTHAGSLPVKGQALLGEFYSPHTQVWLILRSWIINTPVGDRKKPPTGISMCNSSQGAPGLYTAEESKLQCKGTTSSLLPPAPTAGLAATPFAWLPLTCVLLTLWVHSEASQSRMMRDLMLPLPSYSHLRILILPVNHYPDAEQATNLTHWHRRDGVHFI